MLYHIAKSARFIFVLLLALALFNDCAQHKTARTSRKKKKDDYVLTNRIFIGRSSWYGKRFNGRKTASGERFDMNALTAAHKTLPMGTFLRVKNLDNDKTVIVKVNDRGPFVRGRMLDLSFGAAEKLGFTANGVTEVEARVVIMAAPAPSSAPEKKPIKVSQNRGENQSNIN